MPAVSTVANTAEPSRLTQAVRTISGRAFMRREGREHADVGSRQRERHTLRAWEMQTMFQIVAKRGACPIGKLIPDCFSEVRRTLAGGIESAARTSRRTAATKCLEIGDCGNVPPGNGLVGVENRLRAVEPIGRTMENGKCVLFHKKARTRLPAHSTMISVRPASTGWTEWPQSQCARCGSPQWA